MTDTIEPMVLDEDDKQALAQRLVDQAKADGVDLIGPGGLLSGLTKQVLETALEEEMAEHLGVRLARPGWPQWSQLSQWHPREDRDDRGRTGRA